MNRMFDWNDLRYFLAIAREGSTQAAGAALKVNPSTVQRRLAALEEGIGGKLIERHRTGYRLTDLGQQALDHAEAMEASVAAVERLVKTAETELTGAVRITCPEADMYRLLTPSLERLRAEYPNLRVEFVMTERRLDLSKGEADIALRGGPPGDDSLIGRKIGDVSWHVYASRAYVERHGKPSRPEEIAQHSVIVCVGQLLEAAQVRWFRAHVAEAHIVARSHSVLSMLPAVKSGIGLALLPYPVGTPEEELVRVLDLPAEFNQPITLLVHPDLRNVPRVRAVFDFLVGEIDQLRPLLTDSP
jgi:DNA-binding transcriptional LysR family regulator